MSEILDIILFDEEETTQILVENYLKELTFSYNFNKFSSFSDAIISNKNTKKLVIVSLHKANLQVLNQIHKYSQDKNNIFIVISYDKSADIHVQAIRAGAKDFLFKPLTKNEFLNSLQKLYTEIFQTKKRVVKPSVINTIVSPEKETGKTFFAMNLAKEIADNTKEKVLLIDFNNNLNDLSSRINMEFAINTPTVINKITKPNFNYIEKLNKYPNTENLYILANGVYFDNSSIKIDNLDTFLNQIKQDFRYIFLDVTDELLSANKAIRNNTNIFYSILKPSVNTALLARRQTDAYIGSKKIRYVLNKYNANKDSNLLERIEAMIGQRIFMKIPLNYMATNTSINLAKTLKEISPKLDVVKAYEDMAKFIIDRD